MTGKRRNAGLTLVELLLVTAILGVLGAIMMVTLGPVKKMARVTSCTSHLRQIGLAYKMYQADYGVYPNPLQITNGSYLRDKRVLFCPEDTTIAPLRAASSYRFRAEVPPDYRLVWELHDVNPNMVLVDCDHHLGQKTIVLKGDDTRTTPPEYPYHMVLRAEGSVERIRVSALQQFFQPGKKPILRTIYPGEPGYHQEREARGQEQ